MAIVEELKAEIVAANENIAKAVNEAKEDLEEVVTFLKKPEQEEVLTSLLSKVESYWNA